MGNSPDDQPRDANRESRIAVIDDHPMIRRGLRDLIAEEQGLCVCCEAGDLETAAVIIKQGKPDLVLLDLMFQKKIALPFLRSLKKEPDAPKVLVLTLHPEAVYGKRALLSGADGYIDKERSSQDIIDAIRTVLDGKSYFGLGIEDGLETDSEGNGDADDGDIPQILTDRELEVFTLLGLGLGTKQIAHELGISAKTVETHQSHMKDKLSLSSGMELTRAAILWQAEQR